MEEKNKRLRDLFTSSTLAAISAVVVSFSALADTVLASETKVNNLSTELKNSGSSPLDLKYQNWKTNAEPNMAQSDYQIEFRSIVEAMRAQLKANLDYLLNPNKVSEISWDFSSEEKILMLTINTKSNYQLNQAAKRLKDKLIYVNNGVTYTAEEITPIITRQKVHRLKIILRTGASRGVAQNDQTTILSQLPETKAVNFPQTNFHI